MTTIPAGTVWLVPNTLDFGVAGPVPDIQETLPLGVIRIAARLTHWVVENARTTRGFLNRVGAVVPLAQPLQALSIVELPRPRKGGGAAAIDFVALLAAARQGHDLGVMSEAGLPAVADPGSGLVEAAHASGLRVVALPGPSSLLLAVAASGLNGQSFAFVGYLPVDAAQRASRIREVEALSRRTSQTQVVIETPYRNPVLLAALTAQLQPETRLAVSCGLTLAGEFNRCDRVADWRARPAQLPADVPAVFSLLAR